LERTPYFYIAGGNSILHKDFWRLCKLLKKYDITFSIPSNPFHLTDEVCKRLYEYGCRKYQLSLDGMKEKLTSEHCRQFVSCYQSCMEFAEKNEK